MLPFLESLEFQIIGIWTVCFLFGCYFFVKESL
jgi:hypothetical protein